MYVLDCKALVLGVCADRLELASSCIMYVLTGEAFVLGICADHWELAVSCLASPWEARLRHHPSVSLQVHYTRRRSSQALGSRLRNRDRPIRGLACRAELLEWGLLCRLRGQFRGPRSDPLQHA